eukprot:EC835309.1.p1 GENE.EC835309.1~~EC835309.1.p1  ORF type:complete len:170 (-),score=55.34 EC835309.1:57-566(-)
MEAEPEDPRVIATPPPLPLPFAGDAGDQPPDRAASPPEMSPEMETARSILAQITPRVAAPSSLSARGSADPHSTVAALRAQYAGLLLGPPDGAAPAPSQPKVGEAPPAHQTADAAELNDDDEGKGDEGDNAEEEEEEEEDGGEEEEEEEENVQPGGIDPSAKGRPDAAV